MMLYIVYSLFVSLPAFARFYVMYKNPKNHAPIGVGAL